MASGFHGASRSLQDRFDTRALADRIDQLLVSDTISDEDRAFIEDRDMFFLRRPTTTDDRRAPTRVASRVSSGCWIRTRSPFPTTTGTACTSRPATCS